MMPASCCRARTSNRCWKNCSGAASSTPDQTCAALKRLYVHEDQYDEIVKKFSEFVAKIPVGNGLDPQNLIGPVSNKMQLDKVAAYVDDARARGATIVTGGVRPKPPGFFYPLTVIANAADDMRGEGGTVRPGSTSR